MRRLLAIPALLLLGADECGGYTSEERESLRACARSALGREPTESDAGDPRLLRCRVLRSAVAIPYAARPAASTVTGTIQVSPFARPCAGVALAAQSVRRITTCPKCGARMAGGQDATIVHEKQWDCDGEPSCAHWAVRDKYCGRCGYQAAEKTFYGLHRHCDRR